LFRRGADAVQALRLYEHGGIESKAPEVAREVEGCQKGKNGGLNLGKSSVREARALEQGGNMKSQDTIVILNDLIDNCFDSERGFQEASDNATDRSIKSFFGDVSRERGRYTLSLLREVRGLGGGYGSRGWTGTALHRLWVHIIETLSGRDDQGLLAEADRGDDSLLEHYKEALQKGLPSSVDSVLQAQYAGIKRTQERIKNMRAAAKSACAGR